MPFQIPDELDHPLLQPAVAAVEAAGEELRRFFRSQNRVTAKGVANFVSEADVAAEEMLRRVLCEAEPKARFIGEESDVAADRGGGEPAAAWIVDPLDGTTNFLHGLPHFAVSVGYRRNGRTELGIVHNPVGGEWFTAVAGQGAFLGTERMQVSPVADLASGLYCFGFFYDRDVAMATTLRCVEALMRRQVHGIRRFGAAALDLASIACGRFDGFFEFELQPWDVAAGSLLLEEAGGKVTDCRGNEISPLVRTSVLATNAAVHGELLELVRPYFEKTQQRLSETG